MGIGDDLRRINEASHRRAERKHMGAIEQQAGADLAVQREILNELRALNVQIAWLCQYFARTNPLPSGTHPAGQPPRG